MPFVTYRAVPEAAPERAADSPRAMTALPRSLPLVARVEERPVGSAPRPPYPEAEGTGARRDSVLPIVIAFGTAIVGVSIVR